MKSIEVNKTIFDGYFEMMENLHPSIKQALIVKWQKMFVKNTNSKKSKLTKSFGAFESSKSADELIDEIKSNRIQNRIIEPF